MSHKKTCNISCKKCLNMQTDENKFSVEVKKCFFHLTKEIILNNDLEFIKTWISELYKKYRYSSRVFIFNPSMEEKISFYNLLSATFPRLLRQKSIYKRGDKFVSSITNHILQFAKEGHIKIEPETINTYMKSTKINMNNIDKTLLKEIHLYNCIINQGLSLNDSLKYCYPNRKGKDLKYIIDFHVKRERILWKGLYHLPDGIILMIVDKL